VASARGVCRTGKISRGKTGIPVDALATTAVPLAVQVDHTVLIDSQGPEAQIQIVCRGVGGGAVGQHRSGEEFDILQIVVAVQGQGGPDHTEVLVIVGGVSLTDRGWGGDYGPVGSCVEDCGLVRSCEVRQLLDFGGRESPVKDLGLVDAPVKVAVAEIGLSSYVKLRVAIGNGAVPRHVARWLEHTIVINLRGFICLSGCRHMDPPVQGNLCIGIGLGESAVTYLEMDVACRGGLTVRIGPAIQVDGVSRNSGIMLTPHNCPQGISGGIAGDVDPGRQGDLVLDLQGWRDRGSDPHVVAAAVEA